MATIMYTQEERFLEVKPLDESISPCSRYQRNEAGYFLYTTENKWILPFKKTRIKTNICYISIPNNAVGVISDITFNTFRYNVIPKFVTFNLKMEYDYIEIRSKRLLPFRIKNGDGIALLRIIPTIECHVIIS